MFELSGFSVSITARVITGLAVASVLAGLTLLAGCPSQTTEQSSVPAAKAASFGGTVWGGQQAIEGSKVVAYAVGTTSGALPVVIGTATTGPNGQWTMADFSPPQNGQMVYVVATGGDALGGGGSATNDAIKLMTIAGVWGSQVAPVDADSQVNITELTTVAVAAVLKDYLQFEDCATFTTFVTGSCASVPAATGLEHMAATIGNLVNIETGDASDFLVSQPNSSKLHTTLEKMDTLANILASCVNTQYSAANPSPTAKCTKLFNAELDNPTNTLQAALLAAASPVINTKGSLYSLSSTVSIYTPTLDAAPDDWTVGGNRFAYVSSSDGTVAYQLGVPDGTLAPVPGTACGGPPPENAGNCIAAGPQPSSIAIDPSGRFVYVANKDGTAGGNGVSEYEIGASGTLKSIGSIGAGKKPSQITVANTPYGTRVFVVNQITNGKGSGVDVYDVNNDGTLSPLTSISTDTNSTYITVDSDGTYAWLTEAGPSNKIIRYTVSSSGLTSPVSTSVGTVGPNTIALDPAGGYAYVTTFFTHKVLAYKIGADGKLTNPASTGSGGGAPRSIGVIADSSGTYVYVLNSTKSNGGNPGNISVFQTNDGTLTSIGSVSAGTTPASMILDQSGRYLYVANSSADSTVSSYSIGVDHVPVRSGTFAGGYTPSSVAIDPTGRYVYVANSPGDGTVGDVSAYKIVSSGAPTEIGNYTEAGATDGVAMDPLGRHLYVVNSGTNKATAYTITSDGTLAKIGTSVNTGVFPNGVTVDPSGNYVYVANRDKTSNNVSEYKVKATGALSSIGATPAGSAPYAVVADPVGPFVYTANGRTDNVSAYKVGADGTLAPVTTGGAGNCFPGTPSTPDPMNCFSTGPGGSQLPFSLVVDPTGSYLFAANFYGDGVAYYEIDPVTGTLTAQTPISTGSFGEPYGVAVDPTGTWLYVVDYVYGSDSFLYVCRIDRANHGKPVSCSTSPYNTGGATAQAVTVDPTGRYVYVANYDGNSLAVFAIQPDGSLIAVSGSPFSTNTKPNHVVIGP